MTQEHTNETSALAVQSTSTPVEAAPTLYLICHKVRGEPAFDIAHRLQIGTELGWIVPTSGHRAYPSWSHPLDDAVDFSLIEVGGNPLELPDASLRDHYDPKPEPGMSTDEILGKLGLATKPQVTITRRI